MPSIIRTCIQMPRTNIYLCLPIQLKLVLYVLLDCEEREIGSKPIKRPQLVRNEKTSNYDF